MRTEEGIVVFGEADEKTMAQAKDVASRAERVALMADNHLGYVMPIGGVAAYRNQVSVVGVGFDIACGNCAILTDLQADQIMPHRDELADEIQANISFGVGRVNDAHNAPTDHKLFEAPDWGAIPGQHERDKLRAKARHQLGTVGSGNHYVDVFADHAGRVWVGVHFGSRGFGHTVASGFLALSQCEPWGARVPEREVLLDLEHDLGQAYWAAMQLAGWYAYVGRDWVARQVVAILGGYALEVVHNHHNFAWLETHGGEKLVVVRKGATPARPGQTGFVGGSMGDVSVILQGAPASPESEAAMFSTVHGAGRVMSRREAAGKYRGWGAKRRMIEPGKVSAEMMRQWVVEEQGVVLRGGGLDESPHAYRRLPDVLAAQGNTIEVLVELQPLIVVMAGENEFDPYKD